MKLVWNGKLWSDPTDGAIIPFAFDKAKEAAKESAQDAITDWLLQHLYDWGVWLGHNGLPLLSEGLLLWAMICLLLGITGKGAWLERGVKYTIISILVGVAHRAAGI